MIRGILRTAAITLAVVILCGAAFLGGFATSRMLFPPAPLDMGGAPATWKPYFGVFWEAWRYVHQDFYQPNIDDNALVNGSVGGMVDTLGDPNTQFVDAKRAAIFRSDMQGSFEGIGATVEMREGRLTVVAPIKGTPAERAGLRPDDIILEVDGKIIQNMDVNEAVALIRGPKGTPVTLKVQRANQSPFSVTITRETIRTFSVYYEMIEETKIGYVGLSQFTATSPEELQAALEELMAQKPSGLILDLRQNPGGLLSVTIEVASQFLERGQTVVIVKDKNGNSQPCPDLSGRARACTTIRGGLATTIPLVVLIDKGSASSSEIVAAALRDHKRATLIGVTTFGKGSVQNGHILSDGSQLDVTIAHFFSPSGREINEAGVSPDIEVKITEDDIAAQRDSQLDRAVQFLQNGK